MKTNYVLGFLVSKVVRFWLKNFLNHTVHTLLEDVYEIPIYLNENDIVYNEKIEYIVKGMIEELKQDSSVKRMNALLKLDKLIYQKFALNNGSIREVENWYARRYPRLVATQKENLRKLGKSDDYLELYGFGGVNKVQ